MEKKPISILIVGIFFLLYSAVSIPISFFGLGIFLENLNLNILHSVLFISFGLIINLLLFAGSIGLVCYKKWGQRISIYSSVGYIIYEIWGYGNQIQNIKLYSTIGFLIFIAIPVSYIYFLSIPKIKKALN